MKFLQAVCICLFIFFSSCLKEKRPDFSKGLDYFPNTVGNSYKYSVTDRVKKQTYSVTINVTESILLRPSTRAYLWVYTYPNHRDSNYVTANADTVQFYDSRKALTMMAYYFPFKPTDSLRKPYGGLSDPITTIENVSVPAGSFSDSYVLKEAWSCCNFSIARTRWYVPHIGMVKMDLAEQTFGSPTSEIWTLVDYQLQ